MGNDRLLLSRRGLIGGLTSSSALLLTGCGESQPPTYGNLLRMGDNFTYAMQRSLLSPTSLVREYDRSEVTSMPATGTYDPAIASTGAHDPEAGRDYAELRKGAFADWRLEVTGLVDRPTSFSLADIKRLPRRTQITKHQCEEGWSAIAEWTGVPLHSLLTACGMQPSARYVEFYTYDKNADNIDMIDALHPQTILAYGMNGQDLPIGHGAPLRLRLERQIGYKSLKFLRRIVVSDRFQDLGNISGGWAWYNGI